VELFTRVVCSETDCNITHDSAIFLVGSCFATSIGEKLLRHKFDACINPYGILFNPVSIANALKDIAGKKIFQPSDLICNDNLWHSFSHHGSFSHGNADECLRQLNDTNTVAFRELSRATVLVVTLGTSFVWEHLASGKIVSNCHKIPSREFNHRRLSVSETTETLLDIISSARAVSPCLSVIFTVSPVRYLNRGAHENQLSKSTLLLAVEQTLSMSQNVCYFPSYEIMMDELRDYRFYAEDLVHPSDIAVQYIWEMFSKTYFNDETLELNRKIHQLQLALHHREMHPGSESAEKFKIWIKREIEQFQSSYPGLWSRG